jgi:hypothetical protein
VDAPIEQSTEDPEETEEQTAHSSQRRCLGRTRAQVTPRPEGQRRGGHPPPRARGHPPVEHFDLIGATARQSRPSGLLRSLGGSHLSGIPGLQRFSTLLCTRISIGLMSIAGLLSDLRESID